MTDRCPPLLNMQCVVELFPQYNPVTVYRWRNTKGKARLPEPDLVVGQVDMWTVQTILDWAEAAKKNLDHDVLNRIVSTQ